MSNYMQKSYSAQPKPPYTHHEWRYSQLPITPLNPKHRLRPILTFNPEVQLVGHGLALGVECGAGVAAAAVARHLLQHQRLVAVEHARRRVVEKHPVL